MAKKLPSSVQCLMSGPCVNSEQFEIRGKNQNSRSAVKAAPSFVYKISWVLLLRLRVVVVVVHWSWKPIWCCSLVDFSKRNVLCSSQSVVSAFVAAIMVSIFMTFLNFPWVFPCFMFHYAEKNPKFTKKKKFCVCSLSVWFKNCEFLKNSKKKLP